jgi:hypothetical protein
MLSAALARAGLTDAAGQPLTFTPHDFRRMFITDAILAGLPPHIAQVIAGHRDINVTLGYKAVYPDEVIKNHLAFLARRRAQRPTDEYRTPTDEEWEQFLGHFERRKVSAGLCGRAFATPCIHEHACIRCPMLWPDPAQRPRIAAIRDNLFARIAEAEREGWLGEIEGLNISIAGADDKLAQIDRRTRSQPVDLGIPAIPAFPQLQHRPAQSDLAIFVSDDQVQRTRSIASSAFSFRSRPSSARSSSLSAPSASPRRRLSAFTQLPRVPSLTPRSRATCAIGFPVSRTSRTAPSLKSASNFLRVSAIAVLL